MCFSLLFRHPRWLVLTSVKKELSFKPPFPHVVRYSLHLALAISRRVSSKAFHFFFFFFFFFFFLPIFFSIFFICFFFYFLYFFFFFFFFASPPKSLIKCKYCYLKYITSSFRVGTMSHTYG